MSIDKMTTQELFTEVYEYAVTIAERVHKDERKNYKEGWTYTTLGDGNQVDIYRSNDNYLSVRLIHMDVYYEFVFNGVPGRWSVEVTTDVEDMSDYSLGLMVSLIKNGKYDGLL